MTDRTGSVTNPGAKAGQKEARRPRATVRDQADVLRVLGVLGVLKVATATQIMQLVRPHLSDNKVIRNALLVLQADKLVVAAGSTAGPAGKFGAPDRRGEPSQKLWGLTPAGLESAAERLGRDPELMGGRARGAGAGGAPHAMAVEGRARRSEARSPVTERSDPVRVRLRPAGGRGRAAGKSRRRDGSTPC
jgi:hypothetical protein